MRVSVITLKNGLSIQRNQIMDSGTILISVIMIAVCIAFFMGISFSQKARRRNILNSALQSVGATLDDLGEYSLCGNVIIGWLNGGNELFFYRKSSKGVQSRRILFADIHQARLEKEVRSRPTSSGSYSFVNTIQLRLMFSKHGTPEGYLPLFIQDEDAQVGSELEVGLDWEKRINSRLAS